MKNDKHVNLDRLKRKYPDDDACRKYLFDLKWDDGYVCIKCGNEKGYEKPGFKYQCGKCYNIESSTSNTIFHKNKFGLKKAFLILQEMNLKNKITSVDISKRHGISQTTAWSFMAKVKESQFRNIVMNYIK